MVNNNFFLCHGTILNGKYIIDNVVRMTSEYIEYNAVDLVVKEEVIIRELYLPYICERNIEFSDSILVYDEKSFFIQMEQFKKTAASMARVNEGIYAKNFFYENRTGYLVISVSEKQTKNKIPVKYLAIGLIAMLGIVILCSLIVKALTSNRDLEVSDSDLDIVKSDDLKPDKPDDDQIEKATEETTEETIDPAEIENKLKSKLDSEISGDIIKSFFGDFNDDGNYEIWAVVWDAEGVPYEDVLGDLDSWDLSEKCRDNQYNIETDREYRQLQVWYADENCADMIDDFLSMKLAEEFVNGTSSGWGESTFYYPCQMEIQMIRFGKMQQLVISVEHTWMTARGWGIDWDRTIALYGNEDKPKVYFRDEGSDNNFELRDDCICVVEYEDYYLLDEESSMSALYYPIYYLKDSFAELLSVEIDKEEIEKWDGYKQIYNKAMKQELTFESYEAGAAANVIHTLPVESIEFNQYLYNDSGYVFLNGKASGMMTEFVTAIGEQEPVYAEIDICLELKLKDGKITDYRWLGSHQKESATDFEKISSDL